MRKRSLSLSPAERLATLGFVVAGSFAAFVLTEPLGAVPTSEPPLLEPIPLARGGGFMARPPFDPERHPLDGVGSLPSNAPPPTVDPGPPPEPPIRLVGILADGATHKALFAGMDGWRAAGGLVGTWRIDAIEARRVTLSRGAERKMLDASDALRQ